MGGGNYKKLATFTPVFPKLVAIPPALSNHDQNINKAIIKIIKSNKIGNFVQHSIFQKSSVGIMDFTKLRSSQFNNFKELNWEEDTSCN